MACAILALGWARGRAGAEAHDASAAVVARAEALARLLDGHALAAAELLLAAELPVAERTAQGRVLGELVAKLYHEPHAHRSAAFAAQQGLDRDALYRLYERVRASPVITTLLRQFSPHPHFIQILGRELEDPAWLEQLVTEGYAPPKKIELHLGHRCPADCAFCFSAELRAAAARRLNTIPVRAPFYPDEVRGDRPMSLDEYTSLVDEFRALSPVEHPIMVLSGGAEPLTFKPLPELITYAAARGIRAQLYTSGIAMSRADGDAFYDKLLTADFVRLSLNAATPETYRREMRVDAFERVVTNTRRLVERKRQRQATTELRANFVVGPDNVHELLPFVDLADALGLDALSLRVPYVQTIGPAAAGERERLALTLQSLRERIAEGRYPRLIIDLPERWIVDELRPEQLGIQAFDRLGALFSPTVTPYRHVTHRCTIANPGYFRPEFALGTLRIEPQTPAGERVGLEQILRRFVSGATTWRDDVKRHDTNALANELILRLARDELRAGFRLEHWPLGRATVAPQPPSASRVEGLGARGLAQVRR
ncbi:MAG: radical SAM protein [Proteobacteria bacterium]|nr:radical SAM protein [Pseudomonadota bacterium]